MNWRWLLLQVPIICEQDWSVLAPTIEIGAFVKDNSISVNPSLFKLSLRVGTKCCSINSVNGLSSRAGGFSFFSFFSLGCVSSTMAFP